MALAGVVVYIALPGPDLRAGSVELSDGAVAVARRTPKTYRVVYRVESRTGGDLVVSTDDLSVSRPFEARVAGKRGAPPGGRPTSLTVNAFGRLQVGDTVLTLPPTAAPLDRRPDALLREAQSDGYIEPRERRRVARRLCRVYRMGGDPTSTSLAPVEKTDETYTDVCIDEAGLVLEEVGVVDAKITTRRVAVRVSEEPDLDDELFAVGPPSLDARTGGGSVREMASGSRPPGTFWELPSPPDGFEQMGRYAVVPPQTGFEDPGQRNRLIAFTADVFVDGIDVIVIEQGATLGGTPAFGDEPNARDVRISNLGRGEIVYSFTSTVLRVRLSAGRFVRVLGTVPASRLLAVARSLEETEGGTLEFVDAGQS